MIEPRELTKRQVDYSGQTFGDWTVIRYVGIKRQGPLGRSHSHYWLARCSCGNERVVQIRSLIAGTSKKCRECTPRKDKPAKAERLPPPEEGMIEVRPLSPRLKDYTGQMFNSWRVDGYHGVKRYGRTHAHYWKCTCAECETAHIVQIRSLIAGTSKHCRECAPRKEKPAKAARLPPPEEGVLEVRPLSPRLKDYTGQTFNRWRIDGYHGVKRYGRSYAHYWRCTCLECETPHLIQLSSVIRGTSKKCRRCSHGDPGGWTHPLYGTWVKMRSRCNNPNDGDFKYYGARGIQVCDRWESFWNFAADVGSKPSPEHTLDRIDNDSDYRPGNVRWATPAEQAKNRRPYGSASE